jgi:PTH1 family peptidyl-tRNA hydrolase
MKMVAGLGNPGARYERTRHNLGFRVVDRRAVLVKPQTWMNLSGRAVAALARWYRIEPESVLVVCDDIALPEGRLRVRRGGSDGGHKGLASVLREMGTTDVPRLRVGVGAPVGAAEDWVLAALDAGAEERLEAAAGRAAEAVETWLEEGIEACMNRTNAAPDPGEPEARGPAAG